MLLQVCFAAVESNLVKLETSRTVTLPPTMDNHRPFGGLERTKTLSESLWYLVWLNVGKARLEKADHTSVLGLLGKLLQKRSDAYPTKTFYCVILC